MRDHPPLRHLDASVRVRTPNPKSSDDIKQKEKLLRREILSPKCPQTSRDPSACPRSQRCGAGCLSQVSLDPRSLDPRLLQLQGMPSSALESPDTTLSQVWTSQKKLDAPDRLRTSAASPCSRPLAPVPALPSNLQAQGKSYSPTKEKVPEVKTLRYHACR